VTDLDRQNPSSARLPGAWSRWARHRRCDSTHHAPQPDQRAGSPEVVLTFALLGALPEVSGSKLGSSDALAMLGEHEIEQVRMGRH